MTKQSKAASISKSRAKVSPLYLVQVYDAAKRQGETIAAIVGFLRAGTVVWSNKASIEPVATAFREGRMAGMLGVPRDEAKRILGLKRWSKDASDNDKRRTFAQQQAYRATVSAWSHCAHLAGMPNKLTGATRKPRQTSAPAIVADAKSTAPVVLERVIVPHATSFRDVQSFARNMAALMFKFEQKNAKVIGEYGALFDDYRAAVAKLATKETAVSALKAA